MVLFKEWVILGCSWRPLGEMKRMMWGELEQIHDRIDQMENACAKQPQHNPQACRIRKVQPREARGKNGEDRQDGYDDDPSLVMSYRRHNGWEDDRR